MKNLMKYALACMALASLTACNDTEELNVGAETEKGEGYMSLSIEMPNLGTHTRAANVLEHTAGTKEEQTISTLDVLIFDEPGSNLQIQQFQGSDLVPQAPNPQKPNETTTYTLPAFKVNSLGLKNIVVIVNPLKGKFNNFQTADDLQQVMSVTFNEIKSMSSPHQFMMTNANTTAGENGSVQVQVTKEHNKNNPAVVEVSVERVVAKIEDCSDKYNFSILNSNDQVTFTEVALINGNTKFYPIKKISPTSEETTEGYVVDPNFKNQTIETVQDFYANQFTTFPTKDTEWVKSLDTATRACFYTLENTMTAQEQMNAYTTGLYYKATYVLNGTTGGHVYQYGGKLYNWEKFAATATANGVDLNLLQLTDNSSQEDFEKIHVKKYINGVCYYPFWIRHINNEKPEMGPMEFAVVRNNYYQMQINSVKGIGEHKPTTPDAGTPDEQQESFLNVTVKVLPWTVRKNIIDF